MGYKSLGTSFSQAHPKKKTASLIPWAWEATEIHDWNQDAT